MALVTTVTVITVGGTEFTFEGDAGLSAMRSIANNVQIDATGTVVSSNDTGRVIIPFEAINHALTTVTTIDVDAPEDDNCVVMTPEDGGDL